MLTMLNSNGQLVGLPTLQQQQQQQQQQPLLQGEGGRFLRTLQGTDGGMQMLQMGPLGPGGILQLHQSGGPVLMQMGGLAGGQVMQQQPQMYVMGGNSAGLQEWGAMPTQPDAGGHRPQQQQQQARGAT